MTKKIVLTLFAFAMSFANLNAQRHEIGARLGMSNLVGDIGKTNYFLQIPYSSKSFSDYGFPFYGGIMYRMNFNPYQTLRFDVGFDHVRFNDKHAKEDYRKNRMLSGVNDIYEADAIFEYNFFPVNNEQRHGMLSPYIFAGIGGMLYDVTQVNVYHDFKRNAEGVALAPTNLLDFNTTYTYETHRKFNMFIPFGMGLKYKFNYNWALFGEVMVRKTFTDQLDYSVLKDDDISTEYNKDILSGVSGQSLLQTGDFYSVSKEREAEYIKKRQVGDAKSKDWLNTVSFGVTYSFGRPPCYCD